jgi:hypothetical protein
VSFELCEAYTLGLAPTQKRACSVTPCHACVERSMHHLALFSVCGVAARGQPGCLALDATAEPTQQIYGPARHRCRARSDHLAADQSPPTAAACARAPGAIVCVPLAWLHATCEPPVTGPSRSTRTAQRGPLTARYLRSALTQGLRPCASMLLIRFALSVSRTWRSLFLYR